MIDAKLMRLVDHIEMMHEREIAPGTTFEQCEAMHRQMHKLGDEDNQYGHTGLEVE